ncbi:MAG: TIGR03905 family TSCPD domain-containing protein [Clostridia bacterium]|nr:TIGR03905 family TSCPD domain-containing protein [Clostridia bacterium]
MTHSYKTRGTCSRQIDFEIENGIVKNVSFFGGCNGNLKGIGALVEGRPAEEVIALLKGMKCGFKNTSCPDQLAQALEKALNDESK